jgi:hypothetical protein
MITMQQTTMLATFAIALALGLVTGMLVIPTMSQVFAQQHSDNKFRSCLHAGANHIPFCPD